ncbi:S8 family serine peptidase [Alteromonas lipotrueae]|uniref:S8 family serine peptidase n=1 Tax=Alteromonas lipotrueae TaxID=2803814 RepID=UPI001C476EC9|nr:S8 family serine peptidase [Alteromonas lipotrueae]
MKKKPFKTRLSALSLALLPLMASSHAHAATAEIFDDSVIVVYKENVSKTERIRARASVDDDIIDANSDEIHGRFSNVLNGYIAKIPLRGKSVKEVIKILKKDPAVKIAEPNYLYREALEPSEPSEAPEALEPNDLYYEYLWGLNNTVENEGTADVDIDAPEAWNLTTGDSDVVIGVIDSGIDYNHVDIADNAWMNPGEIPGDGVDNDGNGYIDDVYGIDTRNGDSDPMDDQSHGTHVAGIIGAVGDNSIGVVGVNHDVSIAACKFLGPPKNGGSLVNAIKCIDYFTDLKKNRGINIKAINNSWGGGGYSEALENAINTAAQAGILFVAAAGNAKQDNDTAELPHYPSSYVTKNDNDEETNSLIAVASITSNDEDSGYSYGIKSVDIAAPGSAILSTIPHNRYKVKSGTSMATPYVTGAAALVWSYNPELTPSEMKELLMTYGEASLWAASRTVSGNRVNVYNALENTVSTPSFKLGMTPVSAEIEAGKAYTFNIEVGSIAGYKEKVKLSLAEESDNAFLSAKTAMPGDTVALTVKTTKDTPWGHYRFTVNGESDENGENGEIKKSRSANLYVYPQGLKDFPYHYLGKAVPTIDGKSVKLVINIPEPEPDPDKDNLTVFGMQASVDITHTYSGDLVLSLTSPQGTTAILRQYEGDKTNDIVESYNSTAFKGEGATGDWTLKVLDTSIGDNGTVNDWSLVVTGIGEVGATPPNAAFTYDASASGLSVSVTNNSSDVNDDIVSYSWDFGDGATSTEESPTHVYAETGAYDVTLTVTDSEGQTDVATETVAVSDSNIVAEIDRAMLTNFGSIRVDLSYSGSMADTVMIYRNGELLEEVSNAGGYRAGRYHDRSRDVQPGEYTYMVCDETSACSAPVTVNL